MTQLMLPARAWAGTSALGLAICRKTVVTLSGSLTLNHRLQHGRITGLDTTVRLPLADNPAS